MLSLENIANLALRKYLSSLSPTKKHQTTMASSTGFAEPNGSQQPELDQMQQASPLDATKALDIRDIRRAVPKHCFDPSLKLTLFYIVSDICTSFFLFYLASYIPLVPDCWIRLALWLIVGFVQGLVFTGIWILAHECGHGALFKSKVANDSVGFILHSFLLVPFFSWKFSHSRHHRYANHMEKDTAFVPDVGKQSTWRWKTSRLLGVAEDSPILAAIILVGHQLLGWPLYMLFYITSGVDSAPGEEKDFLRSHFDPHSGVFTPKEHPYILISDLGILGMASVLWYFAQNLGYSFVLMAYGIPYLWVNHWIVAITFLHHTHESVPHFKASKWTFVDGALSTVDRDFGFIGRFFFHGIIEFHVVHHLFSRIPFYHAEEATEAIKNVLVA
ncbi:Fatty acid desaturase, type 1 [Fusarium austroafricanum]|uniref:Fatty acid desaturase, type 1 n=1 Tax=Fusarium austroafricanum TaxID=2364996 RepID=A0A8H4NS65_9HYPO|nr:Fatty acid desaturase, type 1 [Fusarium austroafricanum]